MHFLQHCSSLLIPPDLAPLDCYLFPNLITSLPDRNFGSNEDIIDAVDEYLGDQEKGFCFEGITGTTLEKMHQGKGDDI